MKENKLLSPKEASKHFSVHVATLRGWADTGKIEIVRTVGGQRRYIIYEETGEELICYCRVSSYKQKDDLERQVIYMQEKYPDAKIIKDIGSGLNFKRKGIKAILEQAMSGSKLKVVVAHRDRLGRFAFDLLQWIIERTGGSIVVLDKTELSPEQELTTDLLSILHVFSCRLHGLRSYRNQVSQALSKKGAKEDIKKMD